MGLDPSLPGPQSPLKPTVAAQVKAGAEIRIQGELGVKKKTKLGTKQFCF